MTPGAASSDAELGAAHCALAPRAERLAALLESPPEVLVVGGGITGAGIALDLALRGVRTGLVERDDWAGATSSASSRLVHGGLRYLEQFELGLVRESCLERALLLDNAAGLVWPERFSFPVHRGDRVGLWKMQAGLWLYTALSLPRALGRPGRLGPEAARRALPGLDPEGLRGSGVYLDAATDDARLTLAVVRGALRAGATCVSRVELSHAERNSRHARVELRDRISDTTHTLDVRALVLAGGPTTDELRARAGLASPASTASRVPPTPSGGARWIQATRGSHILVARERLPTDGAVIFPSRVDGRVMFLIPWPRRTVIGTTDLDVDADAAGASGSVRASRAEVEYLLASANALVPEAALSESDVISTWSGLRPLLAATGEDPSARSREERVAAEGPIWTIAGGKLTGYRSMAENLCARLCEVHDLGSERGRHSPTRRHRLPGAQAERRARPAWSRLAGRHAADPRPALEIAWDRRYAAYAPAVRRLCGELPDGTLPLDAETLLGEVDWGVRYEDLIGLTDFFFRRTDLGLDPEPARAAAPRVAERLAGLCGWSDERRRTELAGLEQELAGRAAWRAD